MNKICVLSGEITWDMVGNAVAQLFEFKDDPQISELEIPILSPGGDVDAAWSLFSALYHFPKKITTLAVGRVYSAAIIPYMAGKNRLAYVESYFLFHPTSITLNQNEERSITRHKEELKGLQNDQLLYRQILSTIVGTKTARKLINETESIYLTAEEGHKLGLVTDVIKGEN